MKNMLGLGAAMAVCAAWAVPIEIGDPAFEESQVAGAKRVWSCSRNFRIARSEGHNGSGGLVWESAQPSSSQDAASQTISVKAGVAYYFSALVRTEGLKSKKNGASLCVEWYDSNNKWMAGGYVHGVLESSQDWTLVRGVTREIPQEAAKVVLQLYLPKGSSGKVCFDNVAVEPVDRPPVAFVFSSAYRNVAADGEVRFHASLYRPADAADSKVLFTYRNLAGDICRVPPTSAAADGATLALPVAGLPVGKNEIVCELVSAAGKVLGRASCPFERVRALPQRRVWIDAHKRCIVDGKPFFPLGMYAGRLAGEQLEMYAKGPFNVVMPYTRATREDLDALAAKGLMGFVSLRNELLGTPWAARNKITTQEQVDAYFAAEINKVKDHPALLGWYVNDERPATEIPVRTHLRGVFERCDPNHPTWAVLDRTYDLREFIPTFDALGMDPYPVALKPLKHITEMMAEVNHAIFSDVALWNVPQAFDWGWYRKNEKDVQRFPTEAEIANMNWQHIAHGANGLVAYCFHSLFRDCPASDREMFWGRICRANEPVKRMVPVLLSVDPAPAVSGAPALMPTRVWRKDGEVYVLVVNAAAEKLSAALALSEGAWRVAGVEVGSAVRAEAQGRVLNVELAPAGYAMIRLADALAAAPRQLPVGEARVTEIPLLPDERWYGGAVNLGEDGQPWTASSETGDRRYGGSDFDLSSRCWGGGVMPFLVSDKGRYVWGEGPFKFRFSKGVLRVTSQVEKVEVVTAGKTLREAYLAGAARHFPFSGIVPPAEFFEKPQYNNWIEMFLRGVRQDNCEAIVDEVAKSGLPVGVFMTDGGWMKYHGAELFDEIKYPDPIRYFDKIRANGWKSILWMSHFVSPDSQLEYRKLRYYPHAGLPGSGYEKGLDYLVHTKTGNAAAIVRWWSGISASYDLTNPAAFEYYVARLRKFAADYHFDGFKFDAGNVEYFKGDQRLHQPWMQPCEFGRAYTLVGTRIPYNEYRSGYGTGGREIVQRLHDQPHSWEAQTNIIVNTITAGLIGYPYVVADMIGGGLCGSFFPGKPFYPELVVRSCQLQTLMPMMQFSLAPWRVLDKEMCAICLECAKLHCAFGPYIMKWARHAAKTGEPILRAMDYEFPGEGLGDCLTQFMLGPDWLVAPVLTPENKATVRLPSGVWTDDLGERHVGPKTLELTNVPLARLPRYHREAK